MSAATPLDEDVYRVFDVLHDSMAVLDLEGRILRWNDASARLYGFSRKEAIGKSLRSLVCAATEPAIAAAAKVLHGTGRWEGELPRRTKDGRVLAVDVRWAIQPDAHGHPLHIVEAGRDLTSRKLDEEKFRYTEHRYRNLFQAMAASFWELDFKGVEEVMRDLHKEGVTDFRAHLDAHPEIVRHMMRITRVVDVNDGTVKLFGRGDKRELLANVDPFWPEGSERVFAAGVLAGAAGKPGFSTETRLRTLDGRIFDALFTASYPPDTMGKGTLVIGVIDISVQKDALRKLRASETRYRTLFHHVPIALAQLDMSEFFAHLSEQRAKGIDVMHHIEHDPGFVDELTARVHTREVNAEAMRLFGAATAEEMLGSIAFAWSASPGTLRRSTAARLHGAASYSEETTVTTLDGRSADVLYSIAFASALTEQEMTVVGFVDIGARVRAQATVDKMQTEFAHAARVSMLGELTASIAHEINQPLAAIGANAAAGLRWLKRPEPDLEEVRSATTRIAGDARRAGEIITRIRAMATKHAPEQTAVAMGAIVEESVQFLRHECVAKKIEMVLDLAGDLPHVQGDRVQLQQVVVNLLVNAVQSIVRGPAVARMVRVQTRRHAETLQLEVTDTGGGFASGDVNHLFESFFTTREGGMGMGLRICLSIVQKHGGTIAARNRDEGGASFVVTLPLDNAAHP